MVLKTVKKFHEAVQIVGQLYGVPHGIFQESLTLFYTKVCFKILKFSNRPSVFFPDPGHILFLRIYILSYITAKKVI
jgi:hypothetical protein